VTVGEDAGRSPLEVVVEVTDTLSRPYTAGHQRIVRSLVAALDGPAGSGIEVVPVVRPAELGDYRRLTSEERARLRVHPPGGRARRRAESFGPLSPVVRGVVDLPVSRRARAAAGRLRSRQLLTPEVRALALGLPPIGSVWLDLEPAWRDPEPRADLLARLRASGVRTAALVVDVIAELHPEWYEEEHRRRFGAWLRAHLGLTEVFLCLSEGAEADLQGVAARLGAPGRLRTAVVPLGSAPLAEPVPVGLPPDVGRYVLVVATLDVRKNQQVVLEAFERLRRRHDDLAVVLVGREGRGVQEFVADLRAHPLFGRRLLWLQGIDDGELAWLYRNAFLAVAPSRHEGVGVPVIEALRHGCPTLCTAGGTLEEAGAGRAEVFDPDDPDALAVLVERHLLDDAHHRAATRRAAGHDAPTWDDTARAVAAVLQDLAGRPPPL
jgi:glycosyltransferase involved in cell wall biosynthesis